MNKQNPSALPGVLLLGVDTPIGLTLIRELGQHQVPVYGIASAIESICLSSRYLVKGYVFSKYNEELVNFINEIASKHNIQYLMTVSESRIKFLHDNQTKFKNIIALIPNKEAFLKVLDKDYIYQQARSIGIKTPITYAIENSIIPDDIEYPVVLKWANPNEIMPLLREHNIEFLKYEYCQNRDELAEVISRYRQLNVLPLIQTYCPGHGLGQMVYMHENKPVLRFQHQRIHEWPPEGGFSSLCESVSLAQHQALFQQSIALLASINWEGPAMVEYRYDPKTGQAVLMEINGRFWGSIPLAYYAGAHFAWTQYAIAALKSVPQQPVLRDGIRCMFFIPEMKRLIRIIFFKNKIQDKSLKLNVLAEISVILLHYLKTPYFYVFDWHDPMPFFTDIKQVFKKLLFK